ncbi:hypothetical protein C361_06561 [Cryptococcus neoformans Tu259-1]|uniref:Zn(2)-C6 fungal-type domain-containing protein n=1 Tax=Cryptococcus neoformans Tu259-1 TaxID=1230072 RepID=A0A854QAU3_CRYNE|nr:hypothetical protein C353_06384 [Cryptococcus neoformans var. grubii AD1-83a]OXG11456.1 hypothetical protein C361_06561 [Cryptococcus neoformans var. grubii Tu259-1]OXG46902.1 hypothetical protein C354_06371 [Cryptococcus neoformans var. grubii MW-RSA1955]OXG50616.1 hypothetical protein C352_06389 [Cryptococcus neoformans var. grubii CHC193]OXG57485.1 hypothetical protein C351_06415 [Cryptococcus neoformans var. grubii c8]OXH01995.1 hypothetical protein C369_06507 [Cryptococcus neoformans v
MDYSQIDPQLRSIDVQSPDNASVSGASNTPPRVLARNSACHQCRKRKLKCDAQKPVCGNCAKPRARGKSGDEQPHEDCTWDEPKEPSARTKRRRDLAKRQAMDSGHADGKESGEKTKRARLNELEGRIAAFEGAMEFQHYPTIPDPPPVQTLQEAMPYAQQTESNPYAGNGPYNYRHPPFSVGSLGDFAFHPDRDGQVTPNHAMGQDEDEIAREEKARADQAVNQALWENRMGRVALREWSRSDNVAVESGPSFSPDGQMGMVFPDWPKDLPPPAVIEHAIRVFFEKVPLLPKMLNKTLLLQSLQRSPSNPNFACISLIHAILAITANFISETSLSSPAYFPVGTPSNATIHPEHDFEIPVNPLTRGGSCSMHFQSSNFRTAMSPMARFQLWHRRKAFETFYHYVDKGDKFLQSLQAQIIATTVDQYNAWWTDLWIEAGSCMRIATPMRINESPHCDETSLRRHATHLLPPAQTAYEQAERDRTWWMTFILERSVTASTTWPSSMVNEDITVELPCLQSTFDSASGVLGGSQNFQSPDLLTNHPPEHRDGLSFLIKSLKLLGDVNCFFRRYSRGQHSIAGYVSNPTFRLLLSQINAFRMSFPPEFRRPTQSLPGLGEAKVLDRDLISALWITHSAIMGLGEPLITRDSWMDEGARVTLSAIRATLSLLYDVTSTSYDLSLFSPHCTFVWSLSCRGLIRFMGTALQSNDMVSASVFRSEIEVFRMALKRYGERFPIGIRHLKVVDDLLEEMEVSQVTGLPLSIQYDCRKTHLGDRAVGASITEETMSSQVVTPETSSSIGDFSFSATGTSTYPSSTSANGSYTASRQINTSQSPKIVKPLSSSAEGLDNAAGMPAIAVTSPLLMNPSPGEGFDISSFSFDVNNVVGMFEGAEGTFPGAEFGLWTT